MSAMPRERARKHKPCCDPVERAGDNPTIATRSFARRPTERFDRDLRAVAHMARRARLSRASMGRRTSDAGGTRTDEWSSAMSAATSINSLFAR